MPEGATPEYDSVERLTQSTTEPLIVEICTLFW